MQTNLKIKRGTPLMEKGQALIKAAAEYWDEYNGVSEPSAVVWLQADNGNFVLFTRGEYKDEILRAAGIECRGGECFFENPFMRDTKPEKKDEKDTGSISDGYHTFDELYEHRHMLFINLLMLLETRGFANTFRSKFHSDGTHFDGWFIAEFVWNGEQITYHLPMRLWKVMDDAGVDIPVQEKAPPFDGHSSNDVIDRLLKMTASMY